MDPYNPNAFESNAFGPIGDPNGQPPPPQPAEREDVGTYGGNTIDGVNVIGGTVDGADLVTSAASGIGDLASGAAEVAGDVASGAADAVGGLADGIGAVAEGCGSCSLAVLVMLFAAISTAFALAR